jgi:4-alpha-glucanotransferase
LHPIYINLLAITDIKLPDTIRSEIVNFRNYHDRLARVDVPSVYDFKMRILREIFQIARQYLPEDYHQFVRSQARWLKPYALFWHFSDMFGTSDFTSWPQHQRISADQINSLWSEFGPHLAFRCWLQFIAHRQFTTVRGYATTHRIALRTGFSLFVRKESPDSWLWTENFRFGAWSGLEPDRVNRSGVHTGCPALDWPFMESDNFTWISQRLDHISSLFHAVRILDVSELFRSWELPDGTLGGMMGHYVPGIPLSRPELDARGLGDIHRFTLPYVRWHLLIDKFSGDAPWIAQTFFESRHMDAYDEWFSFKDAFNTEEKIRRLLESSCEDDGRRRHFEICLFELLNDVLLIPDADHPDCYHVRAIPTIEHYELWQDEGWVARSSPSWAELGDDQKLGIGQLVGEYRAAQRPLWVERGLRRLHRLRDLTHLTLSVDFTDIPEMAEIQQTGFLPLRIERLPREEGRPFDPIGGFDYLSECATSTPNLPTMKRWWEEHVGHMTVFWHTEYARWDDPWRQYEWWIASSIVERHLWSRSMWANFLVQDLTVVAEHLRREVTREDRMIDPYRQEFDRLMFTFEFLSDDQRLVRHLRKLAEESRRL